MNGANWEFEASDNDHSNVSNPNIDGGINNNSTPQHELHIQEHIPEAELIDSIHNVSVSDRQNPYVDESGHFHSGSIEGSADNVRHSDIVPEPTIEQIQRVYYTKGLEELETLNLVDLSPLANWKLSSFKQGFGLQQLRDDSPDTYWQSDGSNGSNNSNSNSNGVISNNQLSSPHSITIQFSKRVSLERISLFTNYNLDESYTPSRIQVLAGSSDGWDLSEVCTVNFNKPVGWSHIIFSGIRNDRVLKCFMVKLVIMANHQDGKDTHIRALKCFGKKSLLGNNIAVSQAAAANSTWANEEILQDLSLTGGHSLSGFLLNNQLLSTYESRLKALNTSADADNSKEVPVDENMDVTMDRSISKYLDNAAEVIGFNTGFQSLELKSVSSIR